MDRWMDAGVANSDKAAAAASLVARQRVNFAKVCIKLHI